MSGLLMVVAWVAIVNPPRTRLGVPEPRRAGPAALLGGTLLAAAAVWAIAAASGPLLDALEITPETFRIAAGLVVVVAGLRSFVWERPAEEPVPKGAAAAIWPVAFPRLVTPEVVMLALSAGSREGVGPTLAAATVAFATVAALGAIPGDGPAGRVLAAIGRVVAVLATVAGVFLMVDGIRDV